MRLLISDSDCFLGDEAQIKNQESKIAIWFSPCFYVSVVRFWVFSNQL
jgi:hypothetical protein